MLWSSQGMQEGITKRIKNAGSMKGAPEVHGQGLNKTNQQVLLPLCSALRTQVQVVGVGFNQGCGFSKLVQ